MFGHFYVPLAVEEITCYLGHGTFFYLTLFLPIAPNKAFALLNITFYSCLRDAFMPCIYVAVGGGQWGLNMF